jgi:hypothetical protein
MLKIKESSKKFLRSTFNRFGYDIIRVNSAANLVGVASPYVFAIFALSALQERLRIVVVGANDGRINDPIYSTVRSLLANRSEMVLLEPQSDLNDVLRENYDFHPNFCVINAAVGTAGSLTLHRIRKEYWQRATPPYAVGWPEWRAPTGVTSGNRKHVVDWARRYVTGIADPEAVVEAFEVPCLPLARHLAAADLDTSIDVLQIDAEGEDDTIVHNADLEVTRPKIIHLEIKHLSTERLVKLNQFLSRLGYVAAAHGTDLVAVVSHQGKAS